MAKAYKVDFWEEKRFIRSNRWWWRIVATNGRLVDRSTEGFSTKEIAEENAEITKNSLVEYFRLKELDKLNNIIQ